MPWLLGQLQAFDRFFGSSRSLFPTMEQAEATVTMLLTEHVFLVAANDHGPLGFIAGILTPHLFNPAVVVLSEVFWWVPVEHRGSRAGALLLAAFMAVGKARAHSIVMTLEAESPIEPRSLTRLGFRPKETNYLLEVA